MCGLFAVAGAIIRRIITQKKTEELYLNRYEWVLLVGGIGIIADYLVIPGAYDALFVYERSLALFEFFISSLIGLFLLGIYVGAFSSESFGKRVKSIAETSLGSHIIFIIYSTCLSNAVHIKWKEIGLVFVIMALLSAILLTGVRIGCLLFNCKHEWTS
ncbi:MAG: hypothetical protein WBA22_15905 [Candidatus Methanofastidiosia archaeon]